MDLSYPTEQVYGTSFITDAPCNLFKIIRFIKFTTPRAYILLNP